MYGEGIQGERKTKKDGKWGHEKFFMRYTVMWKEGNCTDNAHSFLTFPSFRSFFLLLPHYHSKNRISVLC